MSEKFNCVIVFKSGLKTVIKDCDYYKLTSDRLNYLIQKDGDNIFVKLDEVLIIGDEMKLGDIRLNNCIDYEPICDTPSISCDDNVVLL